MTDKAKSIARRIQRETGIPLQVAQTVVRIAFNRLRDEDVPPAECYARMQRMTAEELGVVRR